MILNKIQAYKSENAPREMISLQTGSLNFPINCIPKHDKIFKKKYCRQNERPIKTIQDQNNI